MRLSLLLVVPLFFAATQVLADFHIVKDGKEPCAIYVKKGKGWTARQLRHSQEHKGAVDLAKYLKRMSGAEFKVTAVEEKPTTPGILVGSIAGLDLTPLKKGGDGFIIRTQDNQLCMQGFTIRGTMIAVYDFLESYAGCKWWSHNEEFIPGNKTLIIKDLNKTVVPPFWQTEPMNREASSRTNNFQYKGRGVSTEKFSGGHTLYALLAAYGKTHPEIYPYNAKKKKRAPNKLHMCYTAPNIAEALAEALGKKVESKKGNVRDFVYFAGMGDWYGGACVCDVCQKVYVEEGGPISGTMIRMMNKVGEIMEAKYPGIRVGAFAYMSMEAPPKKTKPRHNVVLWVPHLRHCIIHGVDKCSKNVRYYNNVKRWCEIAPGNVYIWDYAVNYGENFMYPFPVLTSMAQNIRLYAKLGIRGIRLQGNYVSEGGDLVVLKNWVWSKQMWNPQLKTDVLIREFCKGYYGPAAEQMYEYVMSLEKLAQESPSHMNEFAKLGLMKAVYLGINPYNRLKPSLGKHPDRSYSKATYELVKPVLVAEMKAADAATWQKKVDAILKLNIEANAGEGRYKFLVKRISISTKLATQKKDPRAYLQYLFKRKPQAYYGQPTLDCLKPLLQEDMKMATPEAWKARAATVDMAELRRASNEFMGNRIRSLLKAAVRNAKVCEVSATFRPLFSKALTLTDGKAPYDRRVKEAFVGLEAIVLWRQGPVVEKNGQLVRADMNDEYTWPRAHSMIVHSRKASAREWSPYRNYQRKFLPWHGGPLVHLRQDDLRVKVTPTLAMRIRQIEFMGNKLLREPGPYTKKPVAGYPSVAGAYEAVRNSCPVGLVVGEPTNTSVLMEAEGGSGLHFKQFTRKKIDILKGNKLRIQLQTKQVNRNKNYSEGSSTSITEYLAGKEDGSVTLKGKKRRYLDSINVCGARAQRSQSGGS